MKDNWSKMNEVVQNIIALAIVAVYLYLIVNGKTVPIEMTGFVVAILFYFGFRVIKKNGGNGS